MQGTGLDTMGGIASVVRVYQDAGLLRRYGVRYIATHCDGGKLRAMLAAYLAFIGLLMRLPPRSGLTLSFACLTKVFRICR
jgi:hypothetical protein